ncbi:emp24p/erv25p- protein [Gryganskiella cystojenkinii]|nr:emp24p/erv25p- protein [Gryganskiella cystojenkinii]
MAINVTRWTICLLVLLSILPSVLGLYFYIEGSEQKCFTEELPKETVVIADYEAQEWDEDRQTFVDNPAIALEAIAEELNGNRIFSQKIPRKGQFKFTSAESGEHAICIFASTASWFSSTKTRVNFELTIRDMHDLASEAKEGTLSDLAQRVRELNLKVADIRREQSYLREHEQAFRDKSEATNSHTVTWTIVQLVVIGLTCATQLRSLRVFFESKKLV